VQHNKLLSSAYQRIAHKKHGAISVVSAMLTSVRHNSFVLWPIDPDPDVMANME
jgi:hypothetical protein